MPHLLWLPSHPDMQQAILTARKLNTSEARLGEAIRLAGHDRDAIQTVRLDRLVDDAAGAASQQPAPKLASFRLAILGSHTFSHLVPAIRVAGLNQRLLVDVHCGAYGRHREALLVGDPALDLFAPQAVLLCLDLEAVMPILPSSADQGRIDHAIDAAMQDLRALWAAARRRFSAPVVQQSFVAQSPRLAGSNEWLLPASPYTICLRLNQCLREAAAAGDVLLLDLEQVRDVGGPWGDLYDPARWHQAKQLVDPAAAPLYGEFVARLIGAIAGRSRRCLVLDLDNTLWGGVVGDCGVEGIVLGQGSAGGEAYLSFQTYVKMLRERGVVLAVCSKNDETFARAPFDRHPEMRIRHDDVACFVANWSDKASNIRAIAASLNLGLDSFVFIDDNPAERMIVRRELPEVAVPELPDDVARYAQTIAAAGYFEAVSLTGEDFTRAADYRASRQRSDAQSAVTDMDGFLSGLEMQLAAGPISAIDMPRAAQLINKSNQFNLTTRRRNADELGALTERDDVAALCFRLRDRFGDSGLVSVVIARPDTRWPGDMLIDTWLMSCRVLGRGVEIAALEILTARADELGAAALIGEYRPSDRNGLVEKHYEALGFEPVDGPTELPGHSFWKLDLGNRPTPRHHMAVELTS